MAAAPTPGQRLKHAILDAGKTQKQVAQALSIDPSSISRWVNGHERPLPQHLALLESLLGRTDLHDLVFAPQDCEVYLATPIAGYSPDAIADAHDDASGCFEEIKRFAQPVYWPGAGIRSVDDFEVADIVAERNLRQLQPSSSFLYLQLHPVVGPTSALIELGIALGRRIKTTIIYRRDVQIPIILSQNFGSVAASINYLPHARVYPVKDAGDAMQLLRTNKRGLLGLD